MGSWAGAGSCSTHGSQVGQVVQHAKRSGWHVMGSRQFQRMHLEVTSYCFMCWFSVWGGIPLSSLFSIWYFICIVVDPPMLEGVCWNFGVQLAWRINTPFGNGFILVYCEVRAEVPWERVPKHGKAGQTHTSERSQEPGTRGTEGLASAWRLRPYGMPVPYFGWTRLGQGPAGTCENRD